MSVHFYIIIHMKYNHFILLPSSFIWLWKCAYAAEFDGQGLHQEARRSVLYLAVFRPQLQLLPASVIVVGWVFFKLLFFCFDSQVLRRVIACKGTTSIIHQFVGKARSYPTYSNEPFCFRFGLPLGKKHPPFRFYPQLHHHPPLCVRRKKKASNPFENCAKLTWSLHVKKSFYERQSYFWVTVFENC